MSKVNRDLLAENRRLYKLLCRQEDEIKDAIQSAFDARISMGQCIQCAQRDLHGVGTNGPCKCSVEFKQARRAPEEST
jgi:hypothetical protein